MKYIFSICLLAVCLVSVQKSEADTFVFNRTSGAGNFATYENGGDGPKNVDLGGAIAGGMTTIIFDYNDFDGRHSANFNGIGEFKADGNALAIESIFFVQGWIYRDEAGGVHTVNGWGGGGGGIFLTSGFDFGGPNRLVGEILQKPIVEITLSGLSANINNLSFTGDWNPNDANADQFTVSFVQAVPEPSTLVIAFGLVLRFTGFRRFRQNAR